MFRPTHVNVANRRGIVRLTVCVNRPLCLQLFAAEPAPARTAVNQTSLINWSVYLRVGQLSTKYRTLGAHISEQVINAYIC